MFKYRFLLLLALQCSTLAFADSRPNGQMANPYSLGEVMDLVATIRGGVSDRTWWAESLSENRSQTDPRALAFDIHLFKDCKEFYTSEKNRTGGREFGRLMGTAANTPNMSAQDGDRLTRLSLSLLSRFSTTCANGEESKRNFAKLINAVVSAQPSLFDRIARVKSSQTSEGGDCFIFNDFRDSGDGYVIDPRSGLVWQRCAVGQRWENNTCSGTAIKLHWGEAMHPAQKDRSLGVSDWRLPTKSEFESVFQKATVLRQVNACQNASPPVSSAIIYPIDSDSISKGYGNYWGADAKLLVPTATATRNVDSSYDQAVLASFDHGILDTAGVGQFGGEFQVRLVRAGKPENIALADSSYEQLKLQESAAQKLKNRWAEEEKVKETQKAEKRRAYAAATKELRESVQVGVRTRNGLVVAVNGDVVKVQRTTVECVMKYSNGKCDYAPITQEVWVKRNELYP